MCKEVCLCIVQCTCIGLLVYRGWWSVRAEVAYNWFTGIYEWLSADVALTRHYIEIVWRYWSGTEAYYWGGQWVVGEALLGNLGLTSHSNDGTIRVKCLAQGHSSGSLFFLFCQTFQLFICLVFTEFETLKSLFVFNTFAGTGSRTRDLWRTSTHTSPLSHRMWPLAVGHFTKSEFSKARGYQTRGFANPADFILNMNTIPVLPPWCFYLHIYMNFQSDKHLAVTAVHNSSVKTIGGVVRLEWGTQDSRAGMVLRLTIKLAGVLQNSHSFNSVQCHVHLHVHVYQYKQAASFKFYSGDCDAVCVNNWLFIL